MKKSKKVILFVTAIALMVVLSSVAASAQVTKIGFVNDEKIKMEYKAWSKAQENWEIEAKAWEDEAIQKQQDLQEMIDEFDKQKLILSQEKKKEKEATIKVKQDDLDDFTRRIFGPGGQAERKQAQLLQPLLDNVTKAIEAVAIQENYDVIFTLQSGLGYIKDSYDLTDKVLKYLDENEG
ncbi:MAG: hypothetical protein DRP35_04760 [Candidatus Zixiibacteriota bacterium]|nr:MAG: hypothetical protein DRP35_04760 [candidate division Zixibacteria bacterium]